MILRGFNPIPIKGDIMKKRALISTYDKTDVSEFTSFLVETGWEILSTGGTLKHLVENNISVIDVSDVTGFPDCFSGRVKTLHPAIHGGILAKRNDPSHIEALEKQGFATIDLVCANLYPFFEKVQTRLPEDEILEFIDMGGPAMLRSAAKNYQDVIVVSDPADYPAVISALKAGNVPIGLRKKLAGKVFNLTGAYDASIARHLLNEDYPDYWALSAKKVQRLRYGENEHQNASLYLNTDGTGSFSSMEQLNGKLLSYNNVRDVDLAWRAVCAYGLSSDGTRPQAEEEIAHLLPNIPKLPFACCVSVKHTTPCGIALGKDLDEAYTKTFNCDPVSIYDSVIACNVPVDAGVAKKLLDLFLNIIIAPDFTEEALEILRQNEDLRIIKSQYAPMEKLEFVSIDGGLLVQDTDRKLLAKWDVVTKVHPDPQEVQDMLFGIKAVTYAKSNAIVIVKNLAALGIASGETNRVWATELALSRASRAIAVAAQMGSDDGTPARVLVTDAFFEFPDVIEVAEATGIKTIVQSGDHQKDKHIIEVCNNLGMAMVFTGTRHFKH